MIRIFKKQKDVMLLAPVKGQLLKLENVHDAMFSKKMLGEGFAIVPEEDTICSPCDGQVTMIANTKHAIGITAINGAEILVHIGLDTVNLQGEGFTILVEENQKVCAGTPLVKLDLAFMKKQGIYLTTPVIVTNMEGLQMQLMIDEGDVHFDTNMMLVKKT